MTWGTIALFHYLLMGLFRLSVGLNVIQHRGMHRCLKVHAVVLGKILIRRETSALTDFCFTPQETLTSMDDTVSHCFCLYVADPATFLASNSVLLSTENSLYTSCITFESLNHYTRTNLALMAFAYPHGYSLYILTERQKPFSFRLLGDCVVFDMKLFSYYVIWRFV